MRWHYDMRWKLREWYEVEHYLKITRFVFTWPIFALRKIHPIRRLLKFYWEWRIDVEYCESRKDKKRWHYRAPYQDIELIWPGYGYKDSESYTVNPYPFCSDMNQGETPK